MAYNTVAIKKDIDGKPIPQHYNSIANKYEPTLGLEGMQKVILFNSKGEEISTDNIVNELEKMKKQENRNLKIGILKIRENGKVILILGLKQLKGN